MRRTAGGFLHPAEKWRLGELNTERLAADAAGVARVAESGSVWDYLPDQPDIDINTYHRQYDFGDSRDTDTTNVWDQTIDDQGGSGGQVLTADNWGSVDGHASIVSDDAAAAYAQYQERTARYVAASGNQPDLWFMTEVRLDSAADSESFVGFAGEVADVVGGDPQRLGFRNTGGEWQFEAKSVATGTRVQPLPEVSGGADMTRLAFNVRWIYDPELLVNLPIASIQVNDGYVRTLLLVDYLVGFSGFLTFAIKNGAGANNTLFLNFLKEVWDK